MVKPSSCHNWDVAICGDHCPIINGAADELWLNTIMLAAAAIKDVRRDGQRLITLPSQMPRSGPPRAKPPAVT
ncbi:MAG: hypothetical protein ACJ8AI_31130, partial [Rhodopila sp.]